MKNKQLFSKFVERRVPGETFFIDDTLKKHFFFKSKTKHNVDAFFKSYKDVKTIDSCIIFPGKTFL